MSAKKSDSAKAPNTPADVDMDRIKKLMGPLPDEVGVSKTDKKKSNKNSKNIAVNEAAEQANEALRALAPDMGEVAISKIVEEPALTEEDNASYLDALENDGKPAKIAPEKPDIQAQEPADEGVAGDDQLVVSAVNDIVNQEGDKVLEAEDEKLEKDKPVEDRVGFKEKWRNFWKKPAARWGALVLLFLLLIGAALYPVTRYFVLNIAGVRASMSISVIDSGTLQPLKNVQVSARGVEAITNTDGKAELSKIKLGKTKLVIAKRAFTSITEDITVGWGSNPKGQLRLQPSGAQYSFVVTDYLSGKPIEKAEAISGEGSAISDKDGRIVLTLDTSAKADEEALSVQITANSYRTETLETTAGNKETKAVKMVPDRKSAFISKRSGTYDVYTIDIDGKNEKKIVPGTGLESNDSVFLPSQNSDTAVLIATRENVKNNDGFLLSTLYIVDTKNGDLSKVEQSEQFQAIGWASSERLVYVKIAAGASAANPKRQRLVSLNIKTAEIKELATVNQFNDVLLAGDKVLYAPSNALAETPQPGLFSINADGTNSLKIVDKEISNIFRNDYETIGFSYDGTSYTYKIGAAASTVNATKTPSQTNRLYINNMLSSKAAWLDEREGKNLVLSYDTATKKDTTLATKLGSRFPVYWLNDQVFVFRVNDGRETADYAVNVNGGEAKKISDVSDTSGVGRWYYY